MTEPAHALTLTGIVKDFDGVRALNGATLQVASGTVHGVIGQNGAGKSTLVKILAGIHAPDAGAIVIDGKPVGRLTPHTAEQFGIHFIHQDRLLVPTFTVAEALFLGHEPARGPILRTGRMRREAARLLREYFDFALPPDRLIADLSAAEQQIVQITRALLNRPRILVFDEPTAALVQREVATLFHIIRRLRDQGITIVYISHYLQEIASLCNRVTVLRNGVDVATVDARTTPLETLVSMMIARRLDDMFPPRTPRRGEVLLEARSLSLRGKFDQISLCVHGSEIVGVTGLVGSGAKELVRALFGMEHAQAGEIRWRDKPIRLGSAIDAVANGVALVPEDRRAHGVALGLSVGQNLSLASLSRLVRHGLVDGRAERGAVDRLIDDLAIKTDGRDALVRTLSGGNQQKVVLGKWLGHDSALYLLDEPTVGVDVGAKVEMYRLIATVAARGAGVLVLSSDLMELIGLCNRVLVLYRGRIVHEADADTTDEDTLLRYATGAGESRDAA